MLSPTFLGATSKQAIQQDRVVSNEYRCPNPAFVTRWCCSASERRCINLVPFGELNEAARQNMYCMSVASEGVLIQHS